MYHLNKRGYYNTPPIFSTFVALFLLEDADKHKPIAKRSSKAVIDQPNEDVYAVSSKPSKPDPLVVAAQKSLSNDESSSGGYSGLVSTIRGELDIRVSPKNVARALRFMNTLIKVLRDKGYDFRFNNGDTKAVLHGEEIKISLREMTKRVLVKDGNLERTDMLPIGILSFRIGYGYEQVMWKDGKECIEEQLPNIIAGLEIERARKKKIHEEAKKWRAELEEKQRKELEIQQQGGREVADFKRLLDDAERWHKSIIARSYLDMIEINSLSRGDISEQQKAMLAWARKRIDDYDPSSKLKALEST